MARKNNKNKKKNGSKDLHGYLQVEIDEYKEQTGKQAIIAGRPTNDFKRFVEEMEAEEIEIPEEIEIDELEEMEEAVNEVEEMEAEEIEKPKKAKKPKQPKKPKKEVVDRTLEIFNFMSSNKNKWYSHRDFGKIGLNGYQVRPHLVKLLGEGKVERKVEEKRNWYKLI